MIVESTKTLKNDFKKKIWKYSALLSASCLVLTYASQFLISEYYTTYFNFGITSDIEVVLFVIGINVNAGQNFGLFVYFYYVMLIINVVEKAIIFFIKESRDIEAEDEEGDSKVKSIQ